MRRLVITAYIMLALSLLSLLYYFVWLFFLRSNPISLVFLGASVGFVSGGSIAHWFTNLCEVKSLKRRWDYLQRAMKEATV